MVNTTIQPQKFKFIFVLGIAAILGMFSCSSSKSEDATNLAEISDVMADNPEQESEKAILESLPKLDGAYVLSWSKLLNIEFEDVFVDSLEMETQLPLFNDTIKALDGKMVQVEGFFVPVSETGDENIVILSAFPYAQCFFCGKAGVESIIDVIKPKYLPAQKLDAKIKLKGKLRLNREDFDFLIYILDDAELIQ
ncbi:MAG: hypothetical protein LC107_14405 [Chitinophagales bacterium]|nr:hypothetical protein [Chitinophagales bacterium]